MVMEEEQALRSPTTEPVPRGHRRNTISTPISLSTSVARDTVWSRRLTVFGCTPHFFARSSYLYGSFRCLSLRICSIRMNDLSITGTPHVSGDTMDRNCPCQPRSVKESSVFLRGRFSSPRVRLRVDTQCCDDSTPLTVSDQLAAPPAKSDHHVYRLRLAVPYQHKASSS
jgi:hypothetical protein